MSGVSLRRRSRHAKLASKPSRLAFELLEPRLNLALDVPAFSSLPGALQTIYLDFDGHITSGTSWNNGATINSPAYSSDADAANFSAAELSVIERTFQRVAEDFAPFQVNVTTVAPPVEDLKSTGGGDTKWGIRVVVTKDVAFNCGCGGIAYIDSFNWSSDTPVFVFNTGEVGVAEAVSHEVGHSLGLSHDGTSSASYYQGHGLGSDSTYWSTIMGVGYYVNVSQWDKGEYYGSNNAGAGANYNKGPDDLSIITSYNGFGYKSDDHGNTSSSASALNVAGSAVSASGIISTRTDVDYFRFSTSAANVSFDLTPASVGANLDIEATLYDSNGGVVATSNPIPSLAASIVATLPAGEYFLKIDGVGAGAPALNPATGYSDYASIGQYTIRGTIGAVEGSSLSIAATSAIQNELNSGSNAFTFTVSRTGDTTGTSTINYAVAGTGTAATNAADFVGGVFPSGSLTFAPGVTAQGITINVQGDTSVEANEDFSVSLLTPSAGTSIAVASASGTILNDDSAAAPPTLSISATNARRAEGTGSLPTPFEFTVTRTGDTSTAASVRYAVSASGANKASASDFTAGFVSNVLLDFAAGVSSRIITVNVRADSSREADEIFAVTLSSALGASITTSTVNGTILNDDTKRSNANAAGSEGVDLIAVADPLWMFVPAELLTAEQLKVPVVTWINGVPSIGDLAHEHEHEHGHGQAMASLADEFIPAAQPATPWDFQLAAACLNPALSASRSPAEPSRINAAIVASVANHPSAAPQGETENAWLAAFLTTDSSQEGVRTAQASSQEFDSIDSAFGDSDEIWTQV